MRKIKLVPFLISTVSIFLLSVTAFAQTPPAIPAAYICVEKQNGSIVCSNQASPVIVSACVDEVLTFFMSGQAVNAYNSAYVSCCPTGCVNSGKCCPDAGIEWDFPGGDAPACQLTPPCFNKYLNTITPYEVTYSAPGTYQIDACLKCSKYLSGDFCVTVTIEVTDAPKPQLEFDLATQFCVGAEICVKNINPTSTLANPYTWDTHGISIISGCVGVNPVCGDEICLIYNTPGTYEIDLSENSGSCIATQTEIFTIDAPVVDFSADVTCPFNVQFTNLTNCLAPNYTWLWDFGDGLTSTEEAPFHNYQNVAGSYTVILTMVAGSNVFTSQQTITVGSLAFDYLNYTVTGNETWTAPLKIQRLLTIESGARLTIKNTEVGFGPHMDPLFVFQSAPTTGVLVKPGGKLIIQNSKLTNLGSCDQKMWSGIQVWGDPAAPTGQLPSPIKSGHGSVIIVGSNSVIENAITGVMLDRSPRPLLIPPNTMNFGGGILTANSATFKNCAIGVDIGSSTYKSFSAISVCNFINDAPLSDQSRYPGLGTGVFVRIGGIIGTRVVGSSFINTNSFDLDKRGTGIRTLNASFNSQGNTFTDLSQGIDVLGTGAIRGADIKDNTFDNVRQQVTFEGAVFSEVTGNTFNIPKGEIIGTDVFPTWGVFAYNSQGFLVTENDFNYVGKVEPNTYGAVTRNSGSYGGDVYLNNFNGDFSVASQIEQNNDVLQIGCNEYIGLSAYDWAITSGSLANQGLCDGADEATPAGNRFHTGLCLSESHIFIDPGVSGFDYSSHPNIPPVCTTSVVSVLLCQPVFSGITSACPSKIPKKGGPGGGTGTTGPGNPGSAGKLIAEINKEKHLGQKQLLENALVRLYIRKGQTTLAIAMLESKGREMDKKLLVAEFVLLHRYVKSRQVLAQIPPTNNDNLKFIELFERLNSIGENNKTVRDMTLADELVIRNVKQSNAKVAVSAESVLVESGKEKYQRFPEAINGQVNLKMSSESGDVEIMEVAVESDSLDTNAKLKTGSMEIVPNPFSGTTTLRYTLPNSSFKAHVVVYDLLGTVVQDMPLEELSGSIQLDLEGNKSGIYFVNLLSDDNLLVIKKAVLVK